MILDTNALSDFLRNRAEVVEIIAVAEWPCLPVIVLGEYRFGVAASRERRALLPKLDECEERFPVLGIDAGTARSYAEIKAELKIRGHLIPENDLWIAALARQHDLPILTRDAHFDAVPGLMRIS
jgi:predicted nucleic acid-binding protein